jgi:hypothetical protein
MNGPTPPPPRNPVHELQQIILMENLAERQAAAAGWATDWLWQARILRERAPLTPDALWDAMLGKALQELAEEVAAACTLRRDTLTSGRGTVTEFAVVALRSVPHGS